MLTDQEGVLNSGERRDNAILYGGGNSSPRKREERLTNLREKRLQTVSVVDRHELILQKGQGGSISSSFRRKKPHLCEKDPPNMLRKGRGGGSFLILQGERIALGRM